MSNLIQHHAWGLWLTSYGSASHVGAAWALTQPFITLMDSEPDHRGSVPLSPTHPKTGLETWIATRRAGRLQCLTRYSTGPHKEENTIQSDLQGIGRRLINSPNLYSVISTVYALSGHSSQGGCLTSGFHCVAKLILNLLASSFWAFPVLGWQAAYHASLLDWDYLGQGHIVLEGKQYHCVRVRMCMPCKGWWGLGGGSCLV